jgi:hypothetical protein
MTMRNAFADMATENGMILLRRILLLLKPLGIITGGGSNRLSVDINNIAGGTVGTVTTVTAVNNQVAMGGVAAFDLMKSMSRTAYNSGVRAKLS